MARPRPGFTLAAALVLTLASGLALHSARLARRHRLAPSPMPDPALLATYKWRSIGPDRGGRSLAVAGVKGQPNVGYFGATGGGLWKTTDGGETWAPVTDGQITSSSVGAVAVAETNPDIVFIGTGESCIRGNIQPGDGVYKSTDAGKTWTHVGFRDAQNISKIRIHPTNPDIVFVAAFGQLRRAERRARRLQEHRRRRDVAARAVPRQQDRRGVDLWIDRNNPERGLRGAVGGVPHGIHDVERRPGQRPVQVHRRRRDVDRDHAQPRPAAPGSIGRIGVSVSGADSNRVYALVENENGGLFRSDDAGATWKLTSTGRNIRQRAFYYTHVTADPHNKDHGLRAERRHVQVHRRRQDAARTSPGGDSHDLWIDPDDSTTSCTRATAAARSPTRARRSRRGRARDYPTGAVLPRHHDDAPALPRVRRAAGRQHGLRAEQHRTRAAAAAAGAAAVAAAPADGGGAAARRCAGTYSPGGAEPGYIAPDPKDPDVFFSGGNNGSFLECTNRRTGQSREVAPVPAHVLRRAVERARRAHPVDVPDRVLAGRSQRALHGDAARVEDDEQRHRLGRASAATSRVTIRRRWAIPADRSRAT